MALNQVESCGSTWPQGAVSPAGFTATVQTGEADHLVIFSAAWSRPAQQMALRAVRLAARHKVQVMTIDVDEQPQLVRRYPVSAVPTLLLFRNGQLAASRIGELSDAQLESWLLA
jgi:thioredoxin 1